MLTDGQREAIRERRPFVTAGVLTGYVTKGGTYVLAAPAMVTDSGFPRDLLAVLPGNIGQGAVLALSITVNPDLVREVTELIEGEA